MPKKSIPKALKIAVWNKYIGIDKGTAKCYCCDIITISQSSFHCGHIIAEANGGPTDITNLVPICESCNKSMRTTNLNDFKRRINATPFVPISAPTAAAAAASSGPISQLAPAPSRPIHLTQPRVSTNPSGHSLLTNTMAQLFSTITGNMHSQQQSFSFPVGGSNVQFSFSTNGNQNARNTRQTAAATATFL